MNGQLLQVFSNWGDPGGADVVFDEVNRYVSAAAADIEVTSPFEFVPQHSSAANALRIGGMLANELLFRAKNKNEYSFGGELVALFLKNNQLSWLQIGLPQIWIYRGNTGEIQPIAVSRNFCLEPNSLLDLPSELLGTEPSIYPRVGQIFIAPEDSLILTHHLQWGRPSGFSPNLQGAELIQTMQQLQAPQDELSNFWIIVSPS